MVFIDSFSEKFVRRRRANIQILFVPLYVGGWNKSVLKEAVKEGVISYRSVNDKSGIVIRFILFCEKG